MVLTYSLRRRLLLELFRHPFGIAVISALSYCYTVPIKKAKLPLSKTHPKLAKEADGWDPSQFTYGSNKRQKWKCIQGHRYEATLANRVSKNSGCPFCSGHKVLAGFNDLATTHPGVAAQADGWDPTKVTFGSGKKVSWKCKKNHT